MKTDIIIQEKTSWASGNHVGYFVTKLLMKESMQVEFLLRAVDECGHAVVSEEYPDSSCFVHVHFLRWPGSPSPRLG